jgi:hypothetical protein
MGRDLFGFVSELIIFPRFESMKVFLSWSGSRSRDVANFLSDWLSCVIQATRPWISTRDLDRGSLWFGEINDQLKDTNVGIICLTQENKDRPWILFEAGALAKGLSTARVCTFLIDLEPKDVEDPLAQFNHTVPERDSILSLVQTLNGALGAAGLDGRILGEIFETYWPRFEVRFKEILNSTDSIGPSQPRPDKDILGEILENTRMMSSRIRKLEAKAVREVDPNRVQKWGGVTNIFSISELGLTDSQLDQIKSLAMIGVPIDSIVEKYAHVAPASQIRDFVEQYIMKELK